ncbi:MAG: intermediate filament-like cell shape determinant CreS [Sphingomonas fennica]
MWLLKGARTDGREGEGENPFRDQPLGPSPFEGMEPAPQTIDLPPAPPEGFVPEPAPAPLAAAPAPAPEPEPEHPALLSAAQAIGGRYEQMHGALDGIARLFEQMKAIEPLMADIRAPLGEEYETRRAEHAELTALRSAYDHAERSLSGAQAQERDALHRLAVTEIALSDSEALRAAQAASLEERVIDLDRLRDELLQAQLRGQQLDGALAEATRRVAELEQDVATLRQQLAEVDAQRNAAEGDLARAQQENALASEEAAVVRVRYDQASADVARLVRSEAETSAQLTAERARLAQTEVAAQAAAAESARLVRSLETQIEVAAAEAAALQTRVDTATARAAKLEELNAQLSARLAEAGTRNQGADRTLVERQTALDRMADRIAKLEAEATALRGEHAAVDAARIAATERADQLAKSLAGHERAAERAEERANQFRGKLEETIGGHEAQLSDRDRRIDALQKEVERSRAETALAEGALETVRRDRDRLQATLFAQANG